jgi:hypothetical protein
MFEHIKKRIIKELVEEVVCLDATGIEIVGHNYISVRERQALRVFKTLCQPAL